MTNIQKSLDLLHEQLGECFITQENEIESYHRDWRGLVLGKALALVRPKTVMQICVLMRSITLLNDQYQERFCIVPVGGRTGLCAGALPLPSSAGYHTILLDLTSLNEVSNPDLLHGSVYAQAGATLSQVQSIAHAHGYLFPISLASEGSCTIGGNLATNAGGTAVLHYGMMRSQCLSLDVVLPTGELLHLGAGLHKDNSGYDLKQLWIGAEGTLGIIVGATLKLQPQPADYASVLIQTQHQSDLLACFVEIRQQTASLLTSFEMFSARCLELLHQTKQLPHRFEPLLATQTSNTCYALVELSLPPALNQILSSNNLLMNALSGVIEQKKIESVLVAQTQMDRDSFWQMREAIPLAQAKMFQTSASKSSTSQNSKTQAKHDVALPISGVLPFLDRVRNQLKEYLGCFDEIVFGHLGDGNLHYNIAQIDFDQVAQINQIVYDCAIACGGSISAEHGIGYIRREALAKYLPHTQIELMHALKKTIDPNGIMNPNKILPSHFDIHPVFKKNSWGLLAFQNAMHATEGRDLSMIDLIYLSHTSSTNQIAKNYLSQHHKPCFVVAEYQSQGRGQQGKIWVSPPRHGLLSSLGLQINRSDLSGLSLVIGLSLRQGLVSYLTQQATTKSEQFNLEQSLDRRLKIKWPNDLYYNNQKLGGILVESHRELNQHDVIIGFGLNLLDISLHTSAVSDQNGAPTISVIEIQKDLSLYACYIDPSKLWAKQAQYVIKNIAQFDSTGFSAFQATFQNHLLWQDQPVLISTQISNEASFRGICRGVDSTGALILETDQGLQLVYSGSIRLDLTNQ